MLQGAAGREPQTGIIRRRFPNCAPPPSPWPKAIPLAPSEYQKEGALMCSIGANLFGLGGPLQDTPPRQRRYPLSPFLRCNTVIGIFPEDFSTLSHTILLFFNNPALTSARNDGKGMESPSRLRYSRKCPFPPHVISSGGKGTGFAGSRRRLRIQ